MKALYFIPYQANVFFEWLAERYLRKVAKNAKKVGFSVDRRLIGIPPTQY